MQSIHKLTASALAAASFAGGAGAAEILVTANIASSTTWTADNTYNLQQQIYVLPGATLTIEAGTIVASDTNIGGSLAVCRGAQIFVQGTQAKPVIMTSKADVATWVGGDPKTGTWREGLNEWGNLTIMGDAYISEDAIGTNTAAPNAANYANMEGLIAAFPGDPNVQYGGGDDDDDSGSIQYLSLRYGGKVIGLNNELNGLSLGGIGRGTDISYVDIQNNVDDGIEIWGGTVNIKYFNIWDIGDDSFDVDQGWRGKAQFGLIVQGYSAKVAQASGDNVFETDGAEQSDYQPVTTASIYNVTVVGQPVSGDHATAWRDNARVQYRNCIFMDVGEQLVKNDNVDGDGGKGYGWNGTLSFVNTWNTAYSTYSAVNAPANPAAFYQAQTSGTLAEITDSVMFRNQFGSAYSDANLVGVFNAGNNNVNVGNDAANMPIKALTRGAAVVYTVGANTLTMLPVTSIDPRPAGAALASIAAAPADGFFTPVQYRGAFDPNLNWLCGWTACDAYGRLATPAASATQRTDPLNLPGSLSAIGLPTLGNAAFGLSADNPTGTCGVGPGSIAVVGLSYTGPGSLFLPFWGCADGPSVLLIDLVGLLSPASLGFYLGAPVTIPVPIPNDAALCGLLLSAQVVFVASGGGLRAGNAVDMVIGD
jgi:hypothetical protein